MIALTTFYKNGIIYDIPGWIMILGSVYAIITFLVPIIILIIDNKIDRIRKQLNELEENQKKIHAELFILNSKITKNTHEQAD